MIRRSIVIALATVLVAAAFLATPSSADAARRRGYSRSSSSSNWGGGTSRYGFYPPRRTHGLKQLGPVPAMGGVRSLKYWGGER